MLLSLLQKTGSLFIAVAIFAKVFKLAGALLTVLAIAFNTYAIGAEFVKSTDNILLARASGADAVSFSWYLPSEVVTV